MAAGFEGQALRLFGHLLRAARRASDSMAAPRGHNRFGHAQALRRWPLFNRGRQSETVACRVAAVPGTTDAVVPVCVEHGTDGRALAHTHEDRAGCSAR